MGGPSTEMTLRASVQKSWVLRALWGATLVGLCLADPPPCSSSSVEVEIVNSADAEILAVETNCSGGFFDVKWVGSIALDSPIVVGNGTKLLITGVGEDAAIDGGGIFRLIEASGDSTVELIDVELRNGYARFGGGAGITSDGEGFVLKAIGNVEPPMPRNLLDSLCETDMVSPGPFVIPCVTGLRSNFTGNRALGNGYGGAVRAWGAGSELTLEACNFVNNTAGFGSGLVTAPGSRVVAEDCVFESNVADDETYSDYSSGGGAIFMRAHGAWAGAGAGAGVGLGGGALELRQCVFRKNRVATLGGGAVKFKGQGEVGVYSSRFEDNRSGGRGAGLCVSGEVEVGMWISGSCKGVGEVLVCPTLTLAVTQ